MEQQPPGQLQREALSGKGPTGAGPCLLTVMQAVPRLWDHFRPSDATRMSSICKLARSQHAAVCQRLFFRGCSLKHCSGKKRAQKKERHMQLLLGFISNNRGYRPTNVEALCDSCLTAGALITPLTQAFGARLTSLSLHLDDPRDGSSSLGLPSEPADWAVTTAAALPALVSLSIHTPSAAEDALAEALLHALAPQLRSLSWGCCWVRRLRGAVLQCMTGLQHLALDSTKSCPYEDDESAEPGVAPACAAALASLTWLRSLHLTSCFEDNYNAPDDAARELAPLSALTGLTWLVLNTPVPHSDTTYAPSFTDTTGWFYFSSWRMSPILSGMRASLAGLDMPSLGVRAEDFLLMAGLACLTRLSCRRVATPAFSVCMERGDCGAGSDGNSPGFPLVPLPPNLRVLKVHALPTLHLAASLALAPSRPRLVLEPDVPEELTMESYTYRYHGRYGGVSSPLALFGGLAVQHGFTLPAGAEAAPAPAAVAASVVNDVNNNGNAIGAGDNGGSSSASGGVDNEGGSTAAASFAHPWLVEMVDLGARVIAGAAEEYVARNRRPVPQALRDQAAADAAAVAAVEAARASASGAAAAAAWPLSRKGKTEAHKLAKAANVSYDSYVRGGMAERLYDIAPIVRITDLGVYEGYHRVRRREAGPDGGDGADDDDGEGEEGSDDDGIEDDFYDDDDYMYGGGGGGGGYGFGFRVYSLSAMSRQRRRGQSLPDWEMESRRDKRGRVRGPHAGWLAALAPLRGLMGGVNMANVELGPGHMRVLLASCPGVVVNTGVDNEEKEMRRIMDERKAVK
ncbi:hypothetical protein Agub_g11469 [Astrephomene gubernaculifera]|uniref:Uncharacterized protein n=1 Tax=Astrephomene gubernaculifera TaxID=47775 RepID=A0AAD3HPV2_9CHLO|nr:hypothetical protein Agub_g11469 [Astrephomene gubernaculifera]